MVARKFFSLNANEVTTIDNQSYISIPVYVIQAWKMVLVFFTL
jgi:hypothetical protein